MAKETFAPNATISDTTKKTAPSANALTVASCNPDITKTDVLTTLNTLAQTPSSKNLHLPLQVLTPKTVKKPCFSPNRQSSTSSSSSNGIKKRGCKGKKPEWKRFQNNVDRSLSRQFWEMDEKYDQELKDFSIASDYQEQYNNTAYDNINGELSYSQDFWIFNGISNVTGG